MFLLQRIANYALSLLDSIQNMQLAVVNDYFYIYSTVLYEHSMNTERMIFPQKGEVGGASKEN